MTLDLLRSAVAAGQLHDIDLHLAITLTDISGNQQPELLLATALVSHYTGQGHICLNLNQIADRPLFSEEPLALCTPPLDNWRQSLRQSVMVGYPGEDTPLVLDSHDRLYLGRYWHFEQGIAQRLKEMAKAPVELNDIPLLRQRLEHFFPTIPGNQPDGQKTAAATALLNHLTIISGGPGTGKTTTITRLLALLIEQNKTSPRIALAAPTGKAAARLTESIQQVQATLDIDSGTRTALMVEATTLHRLLGWKAGSTGFRHHKGHQLPLDILVVDEASMIDMPLMARLLDALPARARLILLGDKDQLASVEAGSVLGDLCNRGAIPGPSPNHRKRLAALGVPLREGHHANPTGPLADALVVLNHSYRFGSDSGIGHLAQAVNHGDAQGVLQTCADSHYPDTAWIEISPSTLPSLIAERAITYASSFQTKNPQTALEAFAKFRFLCALREGPFGVDHVNRMVEKTLCETGLIPPGTPYYPGRPIMITRNDYALRLFNGDIGLILESNDNNATLRAFFPTAKGELRSILLSRLPPHETVYAMTIHKSQGSEFDTCIVILPDSPSQVVTRELVYTGITRAKRTIELWGSRKQLPEVVATRVERTSGLQDALWISDET